MAKSRRNVYEERSRLPESESHHTRRAMNRQLDDLTKYRDLDEFEDGWGDEDELDTFEKIRSPLRKAL
jgi:hypothetical protein